MMREKRFFFLRSLVKGQDHSFFKDLTGVFCTVGGALVTEYNTCIVWVLKMFLLQE
jgi:hypothetical protein